MGEMCGIDAGRCDWDYDGCGLPALAMPLRDLARGFARLANPAALTGARADAATRIHAACTAHPMMVAGSGRACTRVMETLGDIALAKTGAEGVFAGSVPSLGLGFALKIDDGARRASEVALSAVLDALGLLSDAQRTALAPTLTPDVVNSRGQTVGTLRAPGELVASLRTGGARTWSIAHGRRLALPLAMAVAAGDATALVLSLFGLGALNPKGITFFLAFMPQFVDPSQPAAPQLALLGTTFVVLAAFNAAAYALLAAHARRWIDSPARRRPLALGGGGLLCGAGLWTLLAR